MLVGGVGGGRWWWVVGGVVSVRLGEVQDPMQDMIVIFGIALRGKRPPMKERGGRVPSPMRQKVTCYHWGGGSSHPCRKRQGFTLHEWALFSSMVGGPPDDNTRLLHASVSEARLGPE